MLNYIDSHAHLCDSRLLNDIKTVREGYLGSGVSTVVDVGYDIKSSLVCQNNANNFKEVYFTAGIHPENVSDFKSENLNDLSKILTDKKCLALGEIGLDYHYEGYDKKLQQQVFVSQLELANSLNMPVVIHSRDCAYDMLTTLKNNKNLLKNGFIMHC